MTRANSDSAVEQAILEESAEPSRCTAIAVHTEERCRHPPIPGLSVCHVHADATALARLGEALSSKRAVQ